MHLVVAEECLHYILQWHDRAQISYVGIFIILMLCT